MVVYKFGGSSIKDSAGIKNIAGIVNQFQGNLVVIVSALGKTTNALEDMVQKAWDRESGFLEGLNDIKSFHFGVLDELAVENRNEIEKKLNALFHEMEFVLKGKPGNDYDRFYDQVVSRGELWSSLILESYLNSAGVEVRWLDSRELIVTDESFRSANVNWEETGKRMLRHISNQSPVVHLTQGFIGGTRNNLSTTLGREGSDYTAAVFANILEAEKVVIWKDVPGVLNADPKIIEKPVLLPEISYQEAIELAYFGAQVLHPKTIKPLQNKNIPLYVKSYLFPENEGTLIKINKLPGNNTPSIIFKKNQLLISISPRDFSFVIDQNLDNIFGIFSYHKAKVNLIQNSAISISICLDYNERKLPALLNDLQENYEVYYNKGVELITIRHYNDETIRETLYNLEVLIEQKTRATVHYVVERN
ncbi:MAG: aspartate kinase [Bacteroidales bacterium]|nr:aspartate kinase [Bacteroidales bacterium]